MKRELLIAGVGMAAMLGVSWFAARNLYPPLHDPQAAATPTQPEPFEPPAPGPEEDEPPLSSQPPLRVMNVCHCETPYGACRNVAMPVAIAQQFHQEQHSHDLIDMHCASERAEDWHLRRVLLWPERLHFNTRNRLVLADRAARRERMRAEAER